MRTAIFLGFLLNAKEISHSGVLILGFFMAVFIVMDLVEFIFKLREI